MPTSVETSRRAGSAAARGTGPRVVLVSGDGQLGGLVKTILADTNIDFTLAGSGNDAAFLLRGADGSAAAILDLPLSFSFDEIGGSIERLRTAAPGLGVLLLSGYSREELLPHDAPQTGLWFLRKPFRPSSLMTAIRQMIDW